MARTDSMLETPPPPGKRRRWLRRLVLGLLLLPVVLLAMGGVLFWRSITPLSGQLTLAGLDRPVEVWLDREAVPHIFAARDEDGYAALGVLHAQNRLWQMELMRRAGQGRLSEIFGDTTLGRDIFVRTLDLYGAASRSFDKLSPRARAALEAYAAGVNAWMGRRTQWFEPRLAPEFALTWHTPEPWRPANSLVILKMMAVQLGRNLDKEIDRLTFAALGLSPAEIEDLVPTVAAWGAPPLPDIRTLYPLQSPSAVVRRNRASLSHSLADGASNNWVVGGSRTKSGKPLLAGDPHLRLSAPSTWYLVHLAVAQATGGNANLVGASLPGTPIVPLARGDTVAWALTNAETDVQDLFIEKINPANPNQYQTPDGWRDFERSSITLKVRGASDVVIERRSTRHGPVISGVYRDLDTMLGPGHVAALQWTGLDDTDTTLEAALFDVSVKNAGDVVEHTRPTVGPVQAMVVADTSGGIAMVASGHTPRRDASNPIAGRAPVPGWEARYDWTGFLPFEALPRRDKPASDAIGTTNTRIVDDGYPDLITWDWGPTYRQQRYEELIPHRRDHDLASMQAAQLDVVSPLARRLTPLLVAAVRPLSKRRAELDALAAWDGAMRANRAEPLIFISWLRHVIEQVWRDDLGEAVDLSLDERVEALLAILEGKPMSRDWCDDRHTTTVETCGAVLTRALEAAIDELGKQFGGDWQAWAWGAAHQADGLHEPFGRLPLVGDLFNVRVPADGGLYTLNRGKSDILSTEPYLGRDGTTYRGIYDLSNLDASLYIQTTGQSGHPASPYYRSFADRWARGGYIKILTAKEALANDLIGRWQFAPASR